MSSNARLSILVVAVFTAVVAVALALSGGGPSGSAEVAQPSPGSSAPSSGGAGAPVVRDNSHVLSEAPEGSVTLVEFLDFECEACLAAYPVVEQLREAIISHQRRVAAHELSVIQRN